MNINMEHKNIVATIYLKDGKAIKARDNYEEYPDVIELAKLYNDSGIDKIMIFDLSTTDEEHERNIQVIRNINRNIEIKVCAGGNINRMEDIKKFIYAGSVFNKYGKTVGKSCLYSCIVYSIKKYSVSILCFASSFENSAVSAFYT